MTLFSVLLVVHIVAMAVWVGGGFVAAAIGGIVRRTGDAAAFGRFALAYATVGGTWYAGASLVTLLTGLAMVWDGYPSFTDAWVIASIVLWIVSVIVGAGPLGKSWFAMGQRLDAGETIDQQAAALSRIGVLTGVDHLLRIVIIVIMVWRPGS